MDEVAHDASDPGEAEEITAATGEELRAWFEANHGSSTGVWLVYWKARSDHPSVTWSEAVDEALCFGWIDSKVRRIDEERYRQWFSPRKPGGDWSQANRDSVARLEAEGRMAPAGQAAVRSARADGSWRALALSDALVVPDDLATALDADPVRRRTYEGYPPGVKKAILEQVYGAKRPPTRERRIGLVVDAAGRGERPFAL
jgi:uncharacterized protein YdeI (YjbR/CyaY-like superfamily)